MAAHRRLAAAMPQAVVRRPLRTDTRAEWHEESPSSSSIKLMPQENTAVRRASQLFRIGITIITIDYLSFP